jgi:pimeloyl-ACP methyl ester carboxylesterase
VATYLLLHGACHGGWCWDEVCALLGQAGHHAIAPDLPSDDPSAGLAACAEVAVAAVERDAPGDEVVVVGHSLGCLIVPMAAHRLNARRIVMLAGIVGAPHQSLEMLAETDADRDLPMGEDALEFNADGLFRFSAAAARRLLYHDCEPEQTEQAIGRLRFQRSMWTEVADFDAWPTAEIVSITCTDDHVVNPAWSDRMARERLGVEPVHLPGGHSPFLSRPAELTTILAAPLPG